MTSPSQPNKSKLKYLSLFSGVGGFELGIQRAFDNERAYGSAETGQTEPNEDMRQVRQWETVPKVSRSTGGFGAASQSDKLQPRDKLTPFCIGYSEIDKYAIETYESHWKGHKNYGDATTINPKELPDFDLLVGGFPCQAFSVAGKRHGFNDTRGTLFFDIARILDHKRPRHLVLENVKGLLSHDSGKTLQTILGVLTNLGYVVEWQVLNAKDFGVPQNRERIFIVGHLGGKCGRQVFPITRGGEQIASVAGYISEEVWPRRHEQIRRVYKTDGAMPTIPTGQGGGVMTKIVQPETQNHPALDANYYKGLSNQRKAIAVLTPDRLEKRQNGRRFKENGEPSFTLNTQDKHGIYDGARIRRLTPKECERLMSWPDNWTIGSDTQRYKQCGNGVVSNVVQAVMERLQPCLI